MTAAAAIAYTIGALLDPLLLVALIPGLFVNNRRITVIFGVAWAFLITIATFNMASRYGGPSQEWVLIPRTIAGGLIGALGHFLAARAGNLEISSSGDTTSSEADTRLEKPSAPFSRKAPQGPLFLCGVGAVCLGLGLIATAIVMGSDYWSHDARRFMAYGIGALVAGSAAIATSVLITPNRAPEAEE